MALPAEEPDLLYDPLVFVPSQVRSATQIGKAIREVVSDIPTYKYKDFFLSWWLLLLLLLLFVGCGGVGVVVVVAVVWP